MTKIRQYFYLAAGFVGGLLPILLVFKAITSEQAVNITDLLSNFGGIIGAGGALTAGVIVAKQRKDGTIGASPVDQVINNLPVIVQKAADAVADLERVKQATSDVIGSVPILGPLAQQAINSIPSVIKF